jgi:dipeptidyl-peptidase-3
MKHLSIWALALVAGGSLLGQDPAAPPPPKAPATGELERLGPNGRDLLIMGVDAPGFDKLKRTQRLYAYFLHRAALAGNDIYYLQNHRFARDIRDLFEAIYENREGLDPAIAEGVEEYLKLVWANHGNYHHWNHAKFVPRNLTFKQLQQAVKVAKKNGAKFGGKKGENPDKLMARLKPFIFDPKVEPLQVNQTGGDLIKTSASGLYDPGITQKDIEALPAADQQRLNVRFALKRDKRGRRVVEAEPFHVGGVYGEQLATVVFWLKKALPYVDNERVEVEKDGVKKIRFEPVAIQKKALEDLIAYLQDGDEAKFKDHSVAWLKTKASVDYLNGFYEVYKDPRGVIGTYQANVSVRDEALTAALDKLSQNAFYFEGKMPWKDEWKRAKVDPPVAAVVNMLVETGDGGPISAAAYNLPNYADIRKDHGSKNIMLLNIEKARSPKIEQQILEAFYLPEDQELIKKHGVLGRLWLVYLHEVIGHGSGQADATLTEDPARKIGPAYSALEECRADAIALYQFLDPKLVEIGAVPAEEQLNAAKAMFLSTLTHQLRVNGELEGDVVREAHERAGQLILNYLIQPGKDFGVAVTAKDGKHFVQIADVKKAQAGVREIVEKLQTFKSTGDGAGAAAFFEQFGTAINKAWQADAKARLEALAIPKDTAFVFPKLLPVVGDSKLGKAAEGEEARKVLQEVTLETGESFADQMLRFKRWAKSRELAPK